MRAIASLAAHPRQAGRWEAAAPCLGGGPRLPATVLLILGTVWGWQLVPGWVTAEPGFHLGSARPLLAHLFPTL